MKKQLIRTGTFIALLVVALDLSSCVTIDRRGMRPNHGRAQSSLQHAGKPAKK